MSKSGLLITCPTFFAMLSLGLPAMAQDAIRLHADHYPPFNIQTDTTVEGTNGLLLQAAFDELGISTQHLITPWTRAERSARTQPNTCFYSAARSTQREPHYQWVGPLSAENVTLFSLAERPVHLNNLEDAQHWRVGGQLGDTYVQWVVDQGVAVETLGGDGNSFDKLLHNRIDLWVVGSIAGPYIAQLSDTKLLPAYQSEKRFELWMACHKEFPSETIDQLNRLITRYQEDGTLDRIMAGYGLEP
ncbi:MAG: substrate-binding periplasmic protein [Pseudomonas sp.]